MSKKTSKYLVLLTALLVFSFLLASCQSMIASTEEMDRKRAINAWGANLTAQGERYLEEMKRFRALDAWEANLTAQGERYLEEMAQASVPLQGENYLEDMERAGVPVYELRSDVSSKAELVVDALSPGVEIRRTMLRPRNFLTVYTVISDGPGWVVFHADEGGVAGEILHYIWVSSGTHSIAKTEAMEKIIAEPIHVMLHNDFARVGMFEYPGPDEPVLVDNKMVNELCFCPY